jgi:hypothetical protein
MNADLLNLKAIRQTMVEAIILVDEASHLLIDSLLLYDSREANDERAVEYSQISIFADRPLSIET